MKKKGVLQKVILLALILITPMVSTAQNVGQSAPDFTVNTLEGSGFTLSDNLGKVVFIYLFGYACPFCLGNGNSTETGIYDVFKDNPNFVAIGVDTWDGNNSGVESFKSSTGISYSLGLKGSFLEDLYNTTYDRIIVVDQEGIIRYKATARVTASVVNEGKDVIDEYLELITGIENKVNQPSFMVYPIPAQDELWIKSKAQSMDITRVSVYGLQGKVLFQKDDILAKGEGGFLLPLKELENGVYLLRIEAAGKSIVKKFSVAR